MATTQEVVESLVEKGVPRATAHIAYDLAEQASRKALEAMTATCELAPNPGAKTLALYLALILFKLGPASQAEKLLPLVLLAVAAEAESAGVVNET